MLVQTIYSDNYSFYLYNLILSIYDSDGFIKWCVWIVIFYLDSKYSVYEMYTKFMLNTRLNFSCIINSSNQHRLILMYISTKFD